MPACTELQTAPTTYAIALDNASRRRASGALGLLAWLLLFLFACSPVAEREQIVEDDLGRAVHLRDTIERVVTLAPNLTEIVFAAGAGHKLVGVGVPDDFPPQVDALPRYSTYPLDFEVVAALEPDLALASDQVNAVRDAEMLASLDIPTYFLASNGLEEVLESIEAVGRLLGTGDVAAHTADSLRRQIDSLRSLTREAERPLTLFLIGEETLYSFGSESYMHELIELAGGRSATRGLDAEAPVLSEEFVLSIAPEVIIGPWGDDYASDRLLSHHPTWDAVPAVVNERVYGVDPDIVERPGPRLVDGAWALARNIHPELFDAR